MTSAAPVKVSPPAIRPETGRAVATVISEFQPDAIELEERVPPRIARLTLYGVILFVTSMIAWAALSPIDEIVVAPGKLVTTKPTIVTQPLETSVIRSIDVAVGDVVRAGDRLATLDPTFTQADVDQHHAGLASLNAQVRRLEAELADADVPPDAGTSAETLLQARLFFQRRAYRLAQQQNFDQQIAQKKAGLQSGRAQEEILLARKEALRQIEVARETLYKRETGSLLNFLGARDDRLTVDASIAQVRGSRQEDEHAIAKLQADRQAFLEDLRRATIEQLVELRSKRDASAEELKKMTLRRELVTLRAPADAVVLDLAQLSVGSVVREAEPVVKLIPLDVPLEAEVSIGARDIGHVSPGESARVKFDAYPFQRFGTAAGKVTTISRDAFAPERDAEPSLATSQPYFKARVALDEVNLKGLSRRPGLIPGMALSAEIKVGQRKIISYFLEPLTKGLDESIREP